MATDHTIVKGFRTQAAYYPEAVYGTEQFNNTTNGFRIGGKVKSVTWNARQNIMQTGSVGDGRNYKLQLFGQYDANASVSWEVSDFTFLRYALGDIARWGNGQSEANSYFVVEAENVGLDNSGARTQLQGSNVTSYSNIRLRPFSMLLYDLENVSGGSTWNDNVDILKGCMINDFSLSASAGSPLMCNTNLIVREISYRRSLPANKTPTFSTTTSGSDFGDGSALTPFGSQKLADLPPFMYYQGSVKYNGNTLQVMSFNYSHSNQLLTYRPIGERFIVMPTTGMRRHTLSANVILSLPPDSTGAPDTDNNTTTVLELIKNYLGYESTYSFTTSTELSPLGESGLANAMPVEQADMTLKFVGSDYLGNERGAILSSYNLAIEGFGVPVQYENGLIEVPINFSVRGYPFQRVGDGSYLGYTGSGITAASYKPTLKWWHSVSYTS